MAFLTVDEMTKSLTAAVFASLLVLCGMCLKQYFIYIYCHAKKFLLNFVDVGLLTLTQYILLDPILLCFMMGSVLGAVKVTYNDQKEFSAKWWFWLTFTGTMLACCMSVKFVGLFVVLWVGLRTIVDLWNILGDLSRPVVSIYINFCNMH